MYQKLIKKIKGQIRRFIAFKKTYEVSMEALEELEVSNNLPVDFKLADLNDILDFDSLALEYDKESIALSKEWLNKGKMLLVGYHEEVPIMYGWISKTDLDLSLGEVRKLPNQTLYVFKIFIHRHFRGKDLLTAFYKNLAGICKSDGDRVLIWVANSNIPSIKSHEKIGFKAKESYVTFRLGSKFSSYFFDSITTHFVK